MIVRTFLDGFALPQGREQHGSRERKGACERLEVGAAVKEAVHLREIWKVRRVATCHHRDT